MLAMTGALAGDGAAAALAAVLLLLVRGLVDAKRAMLTGAVGMRTYLQLQRQAGFELFGSCNSQCI